MVCVMLPGIDNPGFSDDKVLLPGLSSDMDMSPEGATADAAGQEGVEQVRRWGREGGWDGG